MFKGLPSKERVRQLSREGVFPWSALATRSAIGAASLGVVFGLGGALGRLASPDFVAFAGSEVEVSQVYLSALGFPLGRVVLLTCLVALVAGILISLLQTRGASGRAVQRAVIERSRTDQPYTAFLTLVVSGVIGVVLSLKFASVLLEAFKIEGGVSLASYMDEALRNICKVVVVGWAVLAVLLVFVERLTFMLGVKRKVRKALRGQ